MIRSTLKKMQEVHDSETQELSKQKKDLDVENDELRRKLAKMDMNLTHLQCENKVRRKMAAVIGGQFLRKRFVEWS